MLINGQLSCQIEFAASKDKFVKAVLVAVPIPGSILLAL